MIHFQNFDFCIELDFPYGNSKTSSIMCIGSVVYINVMVLISCCYLSGLATVSLIKINKFINIFIYLWRQQEIAARLSACEKNQQDLCAVPFNS